MNLIKTIECLNSLIVVNNNRKEGYESAQKETDDLVLNKLFSDFQRTSFNCKTELTLEIRKLNGNPQQCTRETGKFFEDWLEVKTALTNNNVQFLLDSCIKSELETLEFYKKWLIQNNEIHSASITDLLNKHYSVIKKDYQTLIQLKQQLISK